MNDASHIIPPELREKPRRPVNSNVEAVEKPHFLENQDRSLLIYLEVKMRNRLFYSFDIRQNIQR